MKEKGQSHIQALWYFRLSLDNAVQRVRVRSIGSVVRVSSGQDVRWADVVKGNRLGAE